MNIKFSPPDISDEDVKAVENVLRSGWITTGPETHRFEAELADYTGCKRVVCLNSNTAGLFLALKMLGIGPGDEVITTPYTYTASASVITHVGAKIVFVDLAKDSYEMDYEKMEAAITSRTKAVIAVDLGGRMCDYDTIYRCVDNKKALFVPNSPLQERLGRVAVLADGAHSLGAVFNGKRSGQAADITCFSFHAVKNLTTAEGGALTWSDSLKVDNDAFYKTLNAFSLHGQSKDAFAKAQLSSWEYDIIYPAYKFNMTDIAGALGRSQLRRYPGMIAARRRLAEQYERELAGLPLEIYQHQGEHFASNYHLMMVGIPGYRVPQRNALIQKMAEAGIATNVHYKPLPMHSAYRALGFDIKDYPNAYKMYEKEITLPLYSTLNEEQVNFITKTLKEILS